MSFSPAFARGFSAGLAPAAGLFTFGIIAGVATVGAGLSPGWAFAMHLLMYAGSSQLVAVQMLSTGSPAPVVYLANVIINLRFILYSLSVRPHLTALTGWRRVIGSYFLSDNTYALTIGRMQSHPSDRTQADYYLGNGASVWVAWNLGGLAGVLIGARIPPAWGLEFIVVLVFLGMGVLQIRDRACAVAAVASAFVAVAAWSLPFKLGIILATFAGIAAGMAAERALEAQRT